MKERSLADKQPVTFHKWVRVTNTSRKLENINEIIGWHIMKISLVFLNANGSTDRKSS